MRLALLLLVSSLVACGGEEEATPTPEAPSPEGPTAEPEGPAEPEDPAEPAEPAEPEPAVSVLLGGGAFDTSCTRDADCAVVDVGCGTRQAVRRGAEEEARASLERVFHGDCHAAEWKPPETTQPYCGDGQCYFDLIVFPDHPRCEPEDACVRIDDPCGGPIAVRADGVRAARREIRSARRRRLCRRFDHTEDHQEAAEPRCLRGFCQ